VRMNTTGSMNTHCASGRCRVHLIAEELHE
jgi:hypothetical protein